MCGCRGARSGSRPPSIRSRRGGSSGCRRRSWRGPRWGEGRAAPRNPERSRLSDDWDERFAIFAAEMGLGRERSPDRRGAAPRPEVVEAWRLLMLTRGRIRIEELAERVFPAAGSRRCSPPSSGSRRRRRRGRCASPTRSCGSGRRCGRAPRPRAGWPTGAATPGGPDRSGGVARPRPRPARFAAECGFADQSHLDREFRGFAGTSPWAGSPRSSQTSKTAATARREIGRHELHRERTHRLAHLPRPGLPRADRFPDRGTRLRRERRPRGGRRDRPRPARLARGRRRHARQDRENVNWRLEPGSGSAYVVTADIDALHARAAAAGAEILEGPVERDYGSRDVVVRDPEGNLWSFGTYAGEPHGGRDAAEG